MSEMTEQEALSVLHQVRGLRDAFLGFNHVVDKLTPVIGLISQARQDVAALESLKEGLENDILALNEQKQKAAEASAGEVQRLLGLREQINLIAKALK